MTALLKAGDKAALAGVCRLAGISRQPRRPGAPHSSDGPDPGERADHPGGSCEPAAASQADRVSPLAPPEAELEALREELRDAAQAAEAREQDAFERGRLEGEQQAVRRADEALARLSTALRQAEAEFSDRFVRFEALSLQIAQTALAQIFGDESRFAGMVCEAVRHQIATLGEHLAAGARVSSADFPDQEALDALGAQMRKLHIAIDPALASGECAIDLRMGQVDASIGKQWSALCAIMEDLAAEGAA